MQLCLVDNVNTDRHSWHQGRFNTKQELLLSTLETIKEVIQLVYVVQGLPTRLSHTHAFNHNYLPIWENKPYTTLTLYQIPGGSPTVVVLLYLSLCVVLNFLTCRSSPRRSYSVPGLTLDLSTPASYPAGRAAIEHVGSVGACCVLLGKQSLCQTLARGGQSLTSVLH